MHGDLSCGEVTKAGWEGESELWGDEVDEGSCREQDAQEGRHAGLDGYGTGRRGLVGLRADASGAFISMTGGGSPLAVRSVTARRNRTA